jgi:hypothetical protein
VLGRWHDVDEEDRPQVLTLTAAQFGLEEIRELEKTADAFRTWDHQYGGGMRQKAVLGQLNELAELLHHPHSRPLRQNLFNVTAQLAIVAGHMAGDSGQGSTAYRYLGLALESARESRDSGTGARAANATARRLLADGHPDKALALLHHAQHSLHCLTDDRAALLLASEAWTHAHLGDYDATAASVDRASELLARNPQPGLFGAAEMAGISGACFETLAFRSDRTRTAIYARLAAQHITEALKLREPFYLRSQALDLLGLANVQLQQREADEAMKTAALALEQAARLRSARVARRVHRLAIRALEQFPGNPHVSEFAEKVRSRLPVT